MVLTVVNRLGGPSPLTCNHTCVVASIAVARLIELAQYSQREAWDKVFTLPTHSLYWYCLLLVDSILWLAKWPAQSEGLNSCGPGLSPHLYVGSLPVILPKMAIHSERAGCCVHASSFCSPAQGSAKINKVM